MRVLMIVRRLLSSPLALYKLQVSVIVVARRGATLHLRRGSALLNLPSIVLLSFQTYHELDKSEGSLLDCL